MSWEEYLFRKITATGYIPTELFQSLKSWMVTFTEFIFLHETNETATIARILK